ncbi:hypothetical protein ABNF97_12015 [Plantactinospora sp. B6F1]|uniref:hypothetical protein n=1 Tax=Plantactinospora sp. B6F1 TaxID=3158971 RepID=UPI00102C6EDD
MLPGLNSGEVGKAGPTGWATRWVLGTAVGQVVFTGTVRLVLAVLMGAALGGLVVWLVLRRRRPAPQPYAFAATAGSIDLRVRAGVEVPNPAHPGCPTRPGVERVRPRFSPRANRSGNGYGRTRPHS